MPRNGSGSGVDTCYYAGTIPTTLEPYPSETVLEHLREEQHDRMRLLENHGKTIGFSYRSLKAPVLLSCFVFFPVDLNFQTVGRTSCGVAPSTDALEHVSGFPVEL